MVTNRQTKEEQWSRWLIEERHISLSVAGDAHLSIDHERDELRIPVKNISGNVMFHKFRRAPWGEDGPKYRYEYGSGALLYGTETLTGLPDNSLVLITEGELDTLVMRTLGYNAISSTGGASTFKPSWAPWLARFNVVLLYDADRAGVNGAMKVSSILPNSRVAWIPPEYGKDPTDVIHNDGEAALKKAIDSAERYDVPGSDMEGDERLERLVILRDRLREERQHCLRDRDSTPLHRDIALIWVENEMAKEKSVMWRTNRPVSKEGVYESIVERAKSYPITKLVKVNHMGKAPCVYHEESTPSMQVYRDNHAYSYCCDKRSDVIAIYMALNNVDFKTAIDALGS